MRILFSTQSSSLRVFDGLRAVLDRKTGIEGCGFAISDSWAYLNWLKENPDFENRGYQLLKEWEITQKRKGDADIALLAKYEEMLGNPAGLFGAIVADRRLFMGKDCSYSQDYRRRFTDDELLCILQTALLEIDRLFEILKPDLIISFICVTILDYLIYLFAKARGVKFLNLRPTRIGDRVIYGSRLNDPTPEFTGLFNRTLREGSNLMPEARSYIERVREQHGMYEGVVKPSNKPAQHIKLNRKSFFTQSVQFWKTYCEYRASVAANDNHVPDMLRSTLYTGIINPWRARKSKKFLQKYYIPKTELGRRRYAFYPLHSEPEISLLVYARPFVNQIEIIRSFAMSLPADMILVVKEHPWMVGKRRLSAYKKILNIPRVYFASPETEARELVKGASLVTVLNSSVGQEGAMLKRPVVTIGDCPFNALPDTMVRRCRDLRQLPQTIRGLLENHKHDEYSLEAYVAAVIEMSEGLNLYSVLLNRKGVYAERQGDFGAEIEKLANYTMRRMAFPGQEETIYSDRVAEW